MPSVLKQAGYHTAIVGKWHLGLAEGENPVDRGFDHFKGFLGDMMDDYYHHRREGNNYLRDGRAPIEVDGHATDLFTQWAAEYIADRARSPQPFFLYLAYNAPHTPIQPPQASLAKVRARLPDLPEKRAKLVALIEHMDEGVGRVLAALQQAGRSERTLVLFTSDNGGDLNAGATVGANRGGKTTMYEGGLRVPTIARWPGRIAAGSRSDHLAATVDLLPTLAQAAGAASPAGIDGVSFLPALLGQPPAADPNRTIFFVRREGGSVQGLCTYALRRGDWKLVYDSPYAPIELYNLATDPMETDDRAKDPRRRPAAYAELMAEFRRHLQRAGSVPWQ
jgi:arylsulfatase A-like enzyme